MTATTGVDATPALGAGPAPTPAQRRAIEAPAGPVLVVAGPGTGKTFCLIGRIGHLIRALGIPPARICAVTFTNKAADEIAARLRRDVGADAADEVTRGTLHALCLALLREHASLMGLRRGFGLADEDYQKRVLRRLRVRPERQAQLLRLFGRHQLEHVPLIAGRPASSSTRYREALRARGLLDYNDLIALAGELLRRHPQEAAAIRGALGCDPGGRVPGPEPGPVRGDHRAREGAPALLRRGRRRAVHLLLGRGRPSDPGALPGRLRGGGAGRSRPESPLLPPDLRGRPAGHRPQPGAVREAARGRPGLGALRRRLRLRRRRRGGRLAAGRSPARPGGVAAGVGRVRAAVPHPRDRPIPGDAVHRGRHAVPAGAGSVGSRRRGHRLRARVAAGDPRRRRTSWRSRRSPSGCCRASWSRRCGRATATATWCRRSAPSAARPRATSTGAGHGASSSTWRTSARWVAPTTACRRWWTSSSRSGSGRYRNPLEERAAELSDPAAYPGAGGAGRPDRRRGPSAGGGLGGAGPRPRDPDRPAAPGRASAATCGGSAPETSPFPGDLVLPRRRGPPAHAVQGASAPSLPRDGGPVPGLRRLRPGDHRQGDRRLRDRGDRRGAGARIGSWWSSSSDWCGRGGRSAGRRARCTATTMRTSATSRRSRRCGPSSAPSSATICWWRTTGRSSTCRCSAVSRRGSRGWRPGPLRHPAPRPLAAGREREAGAPGAALRRETRAARTTRWTTPPRSRA